MFIYVVLDALMLVVLVAIGYSEEETEMLHFDWNFLGTF